MEGRTFGGWASDIPSNQTVFSSHECPRGKCVLLVVDILFISLLLRLLLLPILVSPESSLFVVMLLNIDGQTTFTFGPLVYCFLHINHNFLPFFPFSLSSRVSFHVSFFLTFLPLPASFFFLWTSCLLASFVFPLVSPGKTNGPHL